MMTNRLTSDGAVWYDDRLRSESSNMITIDWQVKAQYDDDRLKSESAKW